MPDRGRDLKISVLSDVSQFDLAKPAEELNKLGSGAKDTASKVDHAFSEIARSSRSNLAHASDLGSFGQRLDRGLTGAARGAGRSFKKSMKENIGSALGSVDTSGGLKSLSTSLAFGVGSFLGPVGALVGSVLSSGIQTFLDKGEEAKKKIQDLASEMVDAGGKLGRDDIFSKVKQAALDGSLAKLAKDAKELNIPMTQLIDLFGNSGDAQRFLDTIKGIDQETKPVVTGFQDMLDGTQNWTANGLVPATEAVQLHKGAIDRLTEAAKGQVETTKSAEEVAKTYLETLGKTPAQIDAYAAALESAATSTDDFTTALQDSGKKHVASIDGVIAAQNRDLVTLANFQKNTKAVYDAVGQAGVDWANAQGPNAAAAMALLAAAPLNKKQKIVANYKTLHGSMDRAMSGKIDTPLGTTGNPLGEARTILREIQTLYRSGVDLPLRVSAPDFYATVARYKREAQAIASGRSYP